MMILPLSRRRIDRSAAFRVHLNNHNGAVAVVLRLRPDAYTGLVITEDGKNREDLSLRVLVNCSVALKHDVTQVRQQYDLIMDKLIHAILPDIQGVQAAEKSDGLVCHSRGVVGSSGYQEQGSLLHQLLG